MTMRNLITRVFFTAWEAMLNKRERALDEREMRLDDRADTIEGLYKNDRAKIIALALRILEWEEGLAEREKILSARLIATDLQEVGWTIVADIPGEEPRTLAWLDCQTCAEGIAEIITEAGYAGISVRELTNE